MATRPSTSYPYIEEDTSADVVIARMGDDVTPRMRVVMRSAIRHLHAFVKEARPNHDEWLVAIRFLTATGQMSKDWRQDYILLSDKLGVTMLVDAINHSHGDGAMENTILRPFYVENPPQYPNGHSALLFGKPGGGDGRRNGMQIARGIGKSDTKRRDAVTGGCAVVGCHVHAPTMSDALTLYCG